MTRASGARERRADPLRVNPGPKLGRRIARAVVIAAGTALLVAGLIFDAFVYLSQRNALVEDATVQARIAAENSSAAVLFRDAVAATETLASLQTSPLILHAELHDGTGKPIARYSGHIMDGEAQRLVAAMPPDVQHAFVDDRLLVRAPVRERGHTVGHLLLIASLDALQQRVAAYVGITVLASLLAFALAFVLVIRIRREVDATEQRLDWLAYYDPVTGLRNRHAANEQVERLIGGARGRARPFALLLLDLDDFKMVNDTFGHDVGDALLRAVAERLARRVDQAELLYRYGGDEFVMLAPRVEAPQRLAESVLAALREPVLLGAHEIHVRCSIGVAQYPADAADAAALVRNADTAMYAAKGLGKNTLAVFEQTMERAARHRMRIDSELRRAAERGELSLHYQPIVDLARARMVGVEALLRWKHPELGAVSPAEFIPIAETSGLIIDLGGWVLHEACRQMKRWEDQGHQAFFVAINVSARQVRRGVREPVHAALAASGASPRCIELEITEHSMVEDIDASLAQLASLRELGIKVAVDDFGTGLSSLAYLKRLPINKLKIDRAFVKDLPDDSDDAAIASAILSMAQQLGLTVVAEGIETAAQREFLARQGCQLAQGYWYGRPVEAATLTAMLERQAAGEALFAPRAEAMA